MRSEACVLIACFALVGCADLARGEHPDVVPPPDFDGGGAASDAGPEPGVRFAAVHPLLIADCQSCHSSAGVAGSTNLVYTGAFEPDLLQTLRFVDESAPARSRLLTRAAGDGHGGGAIWPVGSSEHTLLLQWIEQGALP